MGGRITSPLRLGKHCPLRLRQPRRHDAGITLIEILIAASIFGVALMALGYYHTQTMIGVRKDGRMVEANQLAITIVEDWRERLRRDDSLSRQYDDGASGTRTVAVDGVDYSGAYTVTPWQLDGSGGLIPVPVGGTPHLFQVDIVVAISDRSDRTYSTLVFRVPGS